MSECDRLREQYEAMKAREAAPLRDALARIESLGAECDRKDKRIYDLESDMGRTIAERDEARAQRDAAHNQWAHAARERSEALALLREVYCGRRGKDWATRVRVALGEST